MKVHKGRAGFARMWRSTRVDPVSVKGSGIGSLAPR